MNDLASTIGLMRREFRDVHAVVSRLDHQTRKLFEPSTTIHRPRGIVARFAAVQLLARMQKCRAADFVKQHFADDRDLTRLVEMRTAMAPATTTATTWAAELAAIVVQDIADNFFRKACSRNSAPRAAKIISSSTAAVARVPTHQPAASGAFVLEGNPIPVGALILGSISLKPKKAAAIVAVDERITHRLAAQCRIEFAHVARRGHRLDDRRHLARQRRDLGGSTGRHCSTASRRSPPQSAAAQPLCSATSRNCSPPSRRQFVRC